MKLIFLFIINVLIFVILLSMMCSCKRNKLNRILEKVRKKLNELVNDLMLFLNVEDEITNFRRKSKDIEGDFPSYLGPSHKRI